MTERTKSAGDRFDDETIIRKIRECIEIGNYEIAEERNSDGVGWQHPDPHRAVEGFNLDDMLNVILTGMLIERRDLDERYLFAGRVSGMRQDARYRGDGLHVLVEWVPETAAVIVTAYRPQVSRWTTLERRR